jgi:predicted phosphohydrolase
MSKHFSKTHPAAGEETHFVESILSGIKTTTIRGNYDYWSKVVDQVNAGKAILSIRYWSDKPYRSKQVELAKCTKIDEKEVFITNGVNGFQMSIDDEYTYYTEQSEIIKNEGFKKDSHFYDWFPQEVFSGIMLGFLEIEKVS